MDIESEEETGRKNLMKESCIFVLERKKDHTSIMKRERGRGREQESM